MVKISYLQMVLLISFLWLLVRGICWAKARKWAWRRELQLLLVYICIIVVVRFTFCPFGKVDGKIQPLVFDAGKIFPLWVNFVPFVHLADYPTMRDALLNFLGNTAMFVPLGIVWPAVFKQLNTHGKVLAAGCGVSLTIELLQLPFFGRATDMDDLILNSLGFALGYGCFLLAKKLGKGKKCC